MEGSKEVLEDVTLLLEYSSQANIQDPMHPNPLSDA